MGARSRGIPLASLGRREATLVKPSCAPRVGLRITLPILLIPLAERGWAQVPAGPTRPVDPARAEGAVTLALIVAAGLLLILGIVGNVLALRLGRDGEGVAGEGVYPGPRRPCA